MGKPCACRLRQVLEFEGYVLFMGAWLKDGDVIMDDNILDHHLRIVAMCPDLGG